MQEDGWLTEVYVPSRGRAGKSSTIEQLLDEGRIPLVVVPREERATYMCVYPQAWVMGVDVQGIGPTRQWILRNARSRGVEKIWMLDDDLTKPSTRRWYGDPYRVVPWTDWLAGVEDVAGGVAAVTGMLRQYGWMEDSAIPNKRVGYAILLRTDGPWNYWPFLHEDTDLTLQILTSGHQTLKLPQFVFHTGHMSHKEGGCQPDYQRGAAEYAGEALVHKWERTHPGLVSLTRSKQGVPVTRIQWWRFRQGGTFSSPLTPSSPISK